MSALEHLAVDVSVKPGMHHALVLGIATDGARAVAVGGQGRDLFLASDDGRAFRTGHSPNGGLRSAWLEGDDVWVVGEYGYAARSRDGGATWEKISTGKWKRHAGPCLFGIVRDEDGSMWLGGDGGFLMRSTDGSTFKKVSGVGESIGRMTATAIGVLVPTDDGHVFVARGKEVRKLGAEAGKGLMMARVTPTGAILAVGDGVAIRSTDGGATFAPMPVRAGLLAGVDVLADGRVVVVGSSGAIFVSSDDGASFAKLAQHVSNGQLWCVCRHGAGALVGGEAGVILRVRDERAPEVVAEPRARVAPVAPAAPAKPPPANPAWAAPPLSTAHQTWKRPVLPVEKRNGVHWTPMLRSLVAPRRGGVDVGVRPLPTLEEAWARFRRAAWADDRVGMERKPKPSTIWEWVTSRDAATRRHGERLLDPAPRRASFEDDAALFGATLERYRGFPMQFHEELWESIADFLVAAEGLPEAIRRAYVGLTRELPYTGVGPFGRLRELLVVADEASYAEAKKAILASYATEWEKSKNETHRGPDIRWTTTYLLPLGPAAGDDERRIHDAALQHVKKFGDFGVHACGLASGDLATLERYMKANGRVRHEFFAGTPRRHIAAILDLEGASAGPALAKMKLAPPFEDSAAENTRWTELLAHVDHEAALEALYAERSREVSATWGNGGLALAARIDFDRVLDFAKRKKDAELVALVERERGKPLDEPPAEVEDPNVAPLAAPTEYVPPSAVRPAMLKNPLDLAPEATFREEETENASYEREVAWDGAPLQGAKAEVVDAFVAHCEKWALPAGLDVLAATPARVHSRLFALGFDQRQTYWANYCLRPILVRCGTAALPALVATLQNAEMLEPALVAAQPIGDVSLAPAMIAAFAGKKHKAAARAWMLRHPPHAAAGALELFGNDGNVEAARALRYLDARGHRDAIVELAAKLGAKAAVVAMLDQDPLALPKAKKPVLPKWLDASKLPKLGATRDELDALLVQLAYSNADEIHPGVRAAKRKYPAAARAAFAWALFESWLATGADPKQGWCMQAIGFLGDDECARKLAALAKAWPGEGASVRAQAALDALLNVGTDAALVNINLLAEKSKFPAFKAAAAERIVAIADARGLTTDELADRLAPTLGLDERGAGELDYGARKLTVSFDERLAPIVKDEKGVVLGDLPKPTKTDDAALAKAAKAKLAGIKKDAKATAALQISRMERAMRTGRRIDARLFVEAFAEHPWMRHLAQRLVWGAHDASGARVATFRVAEDGSLADVKDAKYTLSAAGSASVLHPARMSADERAAWSAVFADYAIAQPFLQLGRPIFEPTAEERGEKRIARFRGRKAEYGALRGLASRGWQRWMDDAVCFAKPLGGRAFATLETDPGWHPSQQAAEIETQTLGDVEVPVPIGELDPVAFSEIVYDVDSVSTS